VDAGRMRDALYARSDGEILKRLKREHLPINSDVSVRRVKGPE
jgi:hypothetical protein